MKKISRRHFLRNAGLSLGATGLAKGGPLHDRDTDAVSGAVIAAPGTTGPKSPSTDFRYSPLSWQTAYCFPDDRFKSLVGERGELRYGNPGPGSGSQYFSEIVEFSVLGMEPDKFLYQRLEAPSVPIIHTAISRPEAFLELTTLAIRRRLEMVMELSRQLPVLDPMENMKSLSRCIAFWERYEPQERFSSLQRSLAIPSV